MGLRIALLICMLAGSCEAWWQGVGQKVVGITGGTDCGITMKPGVGGGSLKNRIDPADDFRHGNRQTVVGIAGGIDCATAVTARAAPSSKNQEATPQADFRYGPRQTSVGLAGGIDCRV